MHQAVSSTGEWSKDYRILNYGTKWRWVVSWRKKKKKSCRISTSEVRTVAHQSV